MSSLSSERLIRLQRKFVGSVKLMSVSIKNLTRRHLVVPRNAFSKIVTDILPGWEISLVFVTPAKARELNKKLRGEDYVPNVLSYALGEKSGEIFICPSEAARQAPSYNLQLTPYTLLLFIHGLLHIKGWVHGAKMDKCERELLAKYVTANSNRNRHRNIPDKNGGCRRDLG